MLVSVASLAAAPPGCVGDPFAMHVPRRDCERAPSCHATWVPRYVEPSAISSLGDPALVVERRAPSDCALFALQARASGAAYAPCVRSISCRRVAYSIGLTKTMGAGSREASSAAAKCGNPVTTRMGIRG